MEDYDAEAGMLAAYPHPRVAARGGAATRGRQRMEKLQRAEVLHWEGCGKWRCCADRVARSGSCVRWSGVGRHGVGAGWGGAELV